MKRAGGTVPCEHPGLGTHAGAIVAVALVWMAAAPGIAWGQWAGGPTGPVYYNGGNVGIGTALPGYGLHYYTTSGTWQNNRIVVEGASWPGLGFLESGKVVWIVTKGGGETSFWSTQENMTILQNGNVGIGTAAPQYKLAVNGTIGAREVIVTNSGWADYPFRPGHRLRPLSEVSAYIQKHRHLPDIPTEGEVKAKGVGLGEMQVKLLAKIEELTLHMIEAERRNRELEGRLARLESAAGSSTGNRD